MRCDYAMDVRRCERLWCGCVLLGVWARPPELAQFVVSNVANDLK